MRLLAAHREGMPEVPLKLATPVYPCLLPPSTIRWSDDISLDEVELNRDLTPGGGEKENSG